MAETLGTLCDKLTIIKLKQYHCDNEDKSTSLNLQEKSLINEMDEFINKAINNQISPDLLKFASNKIYNQEKNITRVIKGNIGELMSELSEINCKIWHEQEKVYNFESVPHEEKNGVIKLLAIFNLERNMCIEQIDKIFYDLLVS